jgi:hypothetical protein
MSILRCATTSSSSEDIPAGKEPWRRCVGPTCLLFRV